MKRKNFSALKIEVQKEKNSYFAHENYIAGTPPYLRGNNSTMFINNPLQIGKPTKFSIAHHPSKNNPEIELAYTLTKGLECIKVNIENNLKIDDIASTLSFSWHIGIDYFNEISKLRAARMLWAKMMKQFNPKNSKSLTLQIHFQPNKKNVTENSFIHSTLKTMAVITGGIQHISEHKFDNNQQNIVHFIQQETGITKTVDPWAGSTFIEKHTEEIANKTWILIQEIEELGGFTNAIESDFF